MLCAQAIGRPGTDCGLKEDFLAFGAADQGGVRRSVAADFGERINGGMVEVLLFNNFALHLPLSWRYAP